MWNVNDVEGSKSPLNLNFVNQERSYTLYLHLIPILNKWLTRNEEGQILNDIGHADNYSAMLFT